MTKTMIQLSIVLLIFLFHISSFAKDLDSVCGKNIIGLRLDGDPQSVHLYKKSVAEFKAKWFSRIICMAENGDAKSQVTLAVAYRDGTDGPPQNFKMAKKWFEKSAMQNNGMAQLNLGRFYEGGHGVPIDFVKAHMWYNLSVASFSSQGNHFSLSTAYDLREALILKMDSQQISEAHKLAEKWFEDNRTN